MISITRERLLTIQQWRETYGPGSNVVLPAEEAEELARVALASLEAEPVYQFWNVKTHEWVGCDKATHDSFAYSQRRVLYTTPPAPVSVPDAMDDQGGVCCEVSYADGWNACRAAMLQGAENVESLAGIKPAPALDSVAKNADSLPGNSPVIPDGWTGSDEANAALIMLDRIETVDSVDDDRIEGIKRIIRGLAAAPQQEVK